MRNYCIIKIAIDNESLGNMIVKNLLTKRLISCAQITEVKSMYWWNDKIENGKEFVIEMKTKKNLYRLVEKEIIKLHNYEVPEVVCVDIIDGYNKYLSWIDDETINV